MPWLIKEGKVLASVEVLSDPLKKAKGLLGEEDIEGAYFLTNIKSVHSFGMKFEIDIAFLDSNYYVLDVVSLKPWRITLPRIRSRGVIEARAGSFRRWDLKIGDKLDIR